MPPPIPVRIPANAHIRSMRRRGSRIGRHGNTCPVLNGAGTGTAQWHAQDTGQGTHAGAWPKCTGEHERETRQNRHKWQNWQRKSRVRIHSHHRPSTPNPFRRNRPRRGAQHRRLQVPALSRSSAFTNSACSSNSRTVLDELNDDLFIDVHVELVLQVSEVVCAGRVRNQSRVFVNTVLARYQDVRSRRDQHNKTHLYTPDMIQIWQSL